MKFVLFVEGHTETKALPEFLRRWLDARITPRVGVQSVRFEGWSEYVDDIGKKVKLNLSGRAGGDVIAAVGLLDLYGPTFYPAGVNDVKARYEWAKTWIEKKVNNNRFRQHFAVHETEAWLFADPRILPAEVAKGLPTKCAVPESVNFMNPTAALLDDIYQRKLERSYKKVTDGANLFRDLDPTIAEAKCPYLARLLADLRALAQGVQDA